MIETRASRLATLCVLLALLVVLAVWFGVSTSRGPLPGQAPTADHLATSQDAHVGEYVQVSGTVVRTDPVVIAVEYEHWTGDRYRTGLLEFTVTDLATPVAREQTLQVYGVLTSEGAIRATNGVVFPAGNVRFMYGVSALAGSWVLVRVVRGWTVDWARLAIERRPESSDSRGSGGSTDA